MPLNIIVPAKQVPDTSNITVEAMNSDGTVNRGALPAIFNPDDLYALELALQLKDQYGGKVAVITMGPPRAAELLKETLYRGTDRVILLSDRKFAASDTLATSYALARTITSQFPQFDLVICGRQAIDGDTAQVGPQIAEKLDIPQVTYTDAILEIKDKYIKISRNLGRTREIVEAQLPLLLTAIKGESEPRWPNAKKLLKYRKAKSAYDLKTDAETRDIPVEKLTQQAVEKDLFIETLGADDIKADPDKIGLKGSPTKVKKIINVVLKGQDLKLFKPDNSGIKELVEELVEERTFG